MATREHAVPTRAGRPHHGSHRLQDAGMIGMLAVLLVLAQFWCPMHPDQRSDSRGACSVCGMRLVPMPPPTFATYPVDLRATPTLAGARLRLSVQHPVSGAIVRKFSIVHERPMHLF